MTNPAFIADLERLEDEIDEALLHGPNDDSQRRILNNKSNGSVMKCSGTGPCTKSSLLAFLRLAPFAASQYFVRFRTKADKVRFWPGTVCPLLADIA
jgi:hypothetical protein